LSSSSIISICPLRASRALSPSLADRALLHGIKQHLRIKGFFDTSENAVKTQLWIAIAVYVLVAIIKKRLSLEASLQTILRILSLALFEKQPVDPLLARSANTNEHWKRLIN